MRGFVILPLLATAALAVAAGAASGPVSAEGTSMSPVKDATVIKECSACHMLYPAGLLPARSWTAIVTGLKDHFGENAELDPETTRRIADYLTANAADSRGANSRMLRDLQQNATPLRITELPSWRRKHERGNRVAPATLIRRGARLKSDCVACHADAVRGYFDDD